MDRGEERAEDSLHSTASRCTNPSRLSYRTPTCSMARLQDAPAGLASPNSRAGVLSADYGLRFSKELDQVPNIDLRAALLDARDPCAALDSAPRSIALSSRMKQTFSSGWNWFWKLSAGVCGKRVANETLKAAIFEGASSPRTPRKISRDASSADIAAGKNP